MKKFSLGRLLLLIGTAAVLFVLGTVVFLLYSSRVTGHYQVHLRLAFDAAELSDTGVCLKSGDDWRLVDREAAEKFYYYMSRRTTVTLRHGQTDDPRCLTLRLGDDVATIAPLSESDGNSAVVSVTLMGKSYRIKITADGLWARLTQLSAP
ncbi:MAG: hypothetical protein VB086_00095 [Clostridiaceae bacterium]|nr:hypothetical protein [Clostridiaceae bacterium]